MEYRNLDCVQRYIQDYVYPTTGSEPPHVGRNAPRTDLAAAFKSPYVGRAVEGLYEYLTDCDKRFHQADIDAYGKFCSVVQSSGTGKSRTVVELMRSKVLGVYINLRPHQKKNSYPPRDDFPAQILTENLSIPAQDYSDRCVALFAAVFTVIRQLLYPVSDSETVSVERILALSIRMCDFESGGHKYFFKLVKTAYETLSKNVQAGPMGALLGGRGAGGKEDDGGSKINITLLNLLTQPSLRSAITQPQLRGEAIVREAYAKLIRALDPFFETRPHEPKLVIAFDEAHVLGEPQGNFRPLHILCRVISSFSRLEVSNWVVFASTTPGVADVSVPKQIITPALRILPAGEYLFAPYSELGWDQLATPLSDISPRNVARVEHIMGFGRPLWKSIAPGLGTVNGLLDAAGAKLCNSNSFASLDSSQAFAVLAQRFGLNVCFGHFKTIVFHDKTISNHLRICLETAEDGTWQDTLYPSEPLLSCAAARLLHDRETSGAPGTNLQNAVHCLRLNMQSGLIETGPRGELVSRILFLVAKDLYLRTDEAKSGPNSRLQTMQIQDRWADEELLDCKPTGVMDYLAFVFGPAVKQEAGNEFEDWYINFSHWICMTDDIAIGDMPTHKWLMRHWTRSSALQCYHNQPIINKVIPMYKLTSETQPNSSASYILISDRLKERPLKQELNSMTPSSLGVTSFDHPYIAILTDFRTPDGPSGPSFALTGEKGSQALRIYAPGMNPRTYPFLETTPAPLAEDLWAILEVTRNRALLGSIRLSMRARVQYGRGMGAEHSCWEA